jgi:cytochrome c oxidase assembly protein subunit 11
MSLSTDQVVKRRSDTRVAVICASIVFGMLGMSYAAVPLYRLFCQVTGFGGTTQRAEAPSAIVLDRVINVRFDANVAPGLGWTFEPLQRTVDVKIGENALAFYRATNVSDKPLTGTSVFNVYPDVTGAYFNKMQCFCFTEQTLQPGESIEMPVSFFVDPAMVKDKDAEKVQNITLSYTFHRVEKPKQSAEAATEVKTGERGG